MPQLTQAQTRYLDEVFTAVIETPDIPYGSTTERCGGAVSENQTHLLDLYEPDGDVLLERPAIVFVNGGGFVVSDRKHVHIQILARTLAKRGYVVVSPDYRVCTEISDPFFVTRVRDAQQDAMAAVRWLRANAAAWRIDPDRIAIGGQSAGAAAALTAAWNPDALPLTNDCCQSFSSETCAVLDFAGFTYEAVEPGEAPALLVHHADDGTVSPAIGELLESNCHQAGVPVEAHYPTWSTPDPHHIESEPVSVDWITSFLYSYLIEACGAPPMPPTGTCPSTAETCSDSFEKTSLLIKEDSKLVAKLRKGPSLEQIDIGNPLEKGAPLYSLCIYDDAGDLAGEMILDRDGDTCDGKDCWKSFGGAPPAGKGFKYKDKLLASDGVFKILYKAGDAGKTKVIVKGKGSGLPDGMAAALQGATGVTVQFRASNGRCLSGSATHVTRDDPDFFKAK